MKKPLLLFCLLLSMMAQAATTGAWRSKYKATTQVYVITFDNEVIETGRNEVGHRGQ